MELLHDAPEGLGDEGLALWQSYCERYQLRPDELAWLEDACRLNDRLKEIRCAHEELGRPLLTTGSMGQEVTHPLLSDQTKFTAAKAALLARIKLPEAASKPASGSEGARKAANARWNRGA